MNNANDSSVKGKWDEVAGKVKQGVGEAVGNDSLANKGAAQQVKGHAEQAWGAVKDAAQTTRAEAETDYNTRRGPTSESAAHDVRESITSTAQNVKEHVEHGMDNLKRKSA